MISKIVQKTLFKGNYACFSHRVKLLYYVRSIKIISMENGLKVKPSNGSISETQ